MSKDQENIEILEGNHLIAKFMGHKTFNGSSIWIGENISTSIATWCAYHESWDKLMPVVEKIQLEGFEIAIFSNYCHINSGKTLDFGYIKGQSKIEAVFCAVITFIKWHNENNI